MHRLPTMHTHGLWAQAGALISYGTHFGDLSRRAATYVNKIIKGENPGEIPVEVDEKLEFVVNLKVANAM